MFEFIDSISVILNIKKCSASNARNRFPSTRWRSWHSAKTPCSTKVQRRLKNLSKSGRLPKKITRQWTRSFSLQEASVQRLCISVLKMETVWCSSGTSKSEKQRKHKVNRCQRSIPWTITVTTRSFWHAGKATKASSVRAKASKRWMEDLNVLIYWSNKSPTLTSRRRS